MCASSYLQVVMLGSGKHLGTDIVWSLRWLPSGAYQEEIKGKHMSFKWGWDGSAGSSCWEQDNTGGPLLGRTSLCRRGDG
jgi:hypothetical protein